MNSKTYGLVSVIVIAVLAVGITALTQSPDVMADSTAIEPGKRVALRNEILAEEEFEATFPYARREALPGERNAEILFEELWVGSSPVQRGVQEAENLHYVPAASREALPGERNAEILFEESWVMTISPDWHNEELAEKEFEATFPYETRAVRPNIQRMEEEFEKSMGK